MCYKLPNIKLYYHWTKEEISLILVYESLNSDNLMPIS